MSTTVGLFYSHPTPEGQVIRAGAAALPVTCAAVAVVLPVLAGGTYAARALTSVETYPSVLDAALAQGWHDVNFLYAEGAWHELLSMNGRRGVRLEPAGSADETAELPTADDRDGSTPQRRLIHQLTMSHVFTEKERDDFRAAGDEATEAEASKIITRIMAIKDSRPRQQPRRRR